MGVIREEVEIGMIIFQSFTTVYHCIISCGALSLASAEP